MVGWSMSSVPWAAVTATVWTSMMMFLAQNVQGHKVYGEPADDVATNTGETYTKDLLMPGVTPKTHVPPKVLPPQTADLSSQTDGLTPQNVFQIAHLAYMQVMNKIKNKDSFELSTLATPTPSSTSSSNDVVIYIPETDHNHITTLPAGTKLCSLKEYSRNQTLSLGDSAYILMNHTVTISFESACFKKEHFIKFKSKSWYNQISWKNILLLKFTIDGLVMDNQNETDYSENDFKNINYEIINSGVCLKGLNIININIVEEDKFGLFMGECDLDFEKQNVDCGMHSHNYKISPSIVQYQMNNEDIFISNIKDTILIKPMQTTVIIETKYCNEEVHITKFTPSDFLNWYEMGYSWIRFDYNIIKLNDFSSLMSISIHGSEIDYWTYKDYKAPVCDKEPKFTFIAVNDIQIVCNKYSSTYNPFYTSETELGYPELDDGTFQAQEDHSWRLTVRFVYIMLVIIILGKAICGFGIYKRRQTRLIGFTTRRVIEQSEIVSPMGGDIVIVSANQQPESQSHSQSQPSEDLPPAYSDLQQTNSNPPGYEDACKSMTLSPPGYEEACRDNEGFQIETETSSPNNIPESVEGNQDVFDIFFGKNKVITRL